MEEYVYTNPQYNSYVNDFGDEYHEPDVEETSSWIGKDVISQLKQIKRRYRDFGEYCDTMRFINHYLDELAERYGGKERFKLYLQLDMVKEYLPIIPVLKKTRENRKYIEGKEVRLYTDRFDASEEIKKIKPNYEFDDLDIDFDITNKKFGALSKIMLDSLAVKELNKKYLSAEIDAIEKFYAKKLKIPTKKAREKTRKKILKRNKKMWNDDYYTMDERIDDYYYRKDNDIDDSYDPNEVVNYKGTTYRKSEADEIEVAEQLKEIGIDLGLRQLSKKTRKVVKKKKKQNKKKLKTSKKANKLRKSYMKKFSDGRYDTFESFRKEVGNWIKH